MIRLQLSLQLDYEVFEANCDFVFNIHAAHTARQLVVDEMLMVSQNVLPKVETDPSTGNRYLRLTAWPGPLKVSYNATVDLNHHFAQPHQITETPVAQLPASVLGYIYPSRYCESDRLHKLAMREFGVSDDARAETMLSAPFTSAFRRAGPAIVVAVWSFRAPKGSRRTNQLRSAGSRNPRA